MFFIFDWDGTLSDSADKIVACLQAAAQDCELPVLSPEQVKNVIGLGLPEALRYLYPQISAAQQEACRVAYAQHFKLRDQAPSAFFPGVLQALNQLKQKNYRLAVATGKSRAGLDRVLSNLDLADFFHHSRCADETASKPNPLMLNQLLEEAKVNVEDAVMVGDTEWDMQMADNIGMRKIAVGYGAHSAERLQRYRPALLIHHFPDILQFLD